jgi:hypothetical protein
MFDRFEARFPAGTNDILEFLISGFGLYICVDALRTRIRADRELRLVKGHPMEQGHVQCDPTEIMEYTQRLGRSVNGIPAAFVLNLDESGFQDWVDCRESKVVVPSGYRYDHITVPNESGANRDPLLICIAADGTHFKPLLISSRKTIDQELTKQGITGAIRKIVH